MRIIYLANARIPTEKAHGIQIMKTCEAFKKLGHDIELIVPRRINSVKDDPFIYYDVKEKFVLKFLPCIDLVKLGFIGFLIQSVTFGISTFFYLRKSKFDILYGREEFSLYFESFMGTSFAWETHTDRYNFVIKRVLKKAKKIVSITHGLKQFYVDQGISPDKIAVSPDAVDVEDFTISVDMKVARKEFGLPSGPRIVMYAGKLDTWKGYDTLLKGAKSFQDDSTRLVIVGGEDKHVAELKMKYKEVIFLGYIPYNKLPRLQKAADVLVVPNTAKVAISRTHTSPLKIFAHMAGDAPIVASDLPSIREVLNEKNSVLVEADNPNALAKGIISVLDDTEKAKSLVRQAKKDVLQYSWEKRASGIIDAIS